MIHPTALVDARAQIDPTARIGPWCLIEGPVRVGPGTELFNNVTVVGDVQIGRDNLIGPQAVIGGRPQDAQFLREPGAVHIGDRNSIHEFVSIHPGTPRGKSLTQVGDDNMLMAYTHLGHDTRLGNHCRLAAYGGLSGHAELGDHVVLSAKAGLAPFVRVGRFAFLAKQTGLSRDVLPFMIAEGQNDQCTVRGANVVGMRRHGFTREDIQVARQVTQLWCEAGRTAEEALHEIEHLYGSHPIACEVVAAARRPGQGPLR